MAQTIKANWGEADIPDQTGRVILITGANSGLGFEATRMLAAKGAHVIMACRDAAKADTAVAEIRKGWPTGRMDLIALDLADLDSVAGAGDRVKALGVSRLDVLINNAGVMMPPKRLTTKQGFELQFGANFLGHFALTRTLFPLIAKDGRIVNVASIADRRGDIRWDDLQWTTAYNPSASYGQSKTANLLFNLGLTTRLAKAGSGITAVAAHPGVAITNLANNSVMGRWLWLLKPMVALGIGPKTHSAAKGALPEVYGAVGEIEPGAYYGPADRFIGPPARAEKDRSPHSADPQSAERLWAIGEQLTGAPFKI